MYDGGVFGGYTPLCSRVSHHCRTLLSPRAVPSLAGAGAAGAY